MLDLMRMTIVLLVSRIGTLPAGSLALDQCQPQGLWADLGSCTLAFAECCHLTALQERSHNAPGPKPQLDRS